MVVHGRVELLAHPLSQKYLQMKWNSYGKYFHLANLLFYSIFLTFVTIFSSLLMHYLNSYDDISAADTVDILTNPFLRLNKTDDASSGIHSTSVHPGFKSTPLMYMCGVAIVTYIVLNTFREAFQVYQQRWHYLLDPINFVSWLLYISASIMVFPMLMGYSEVELQVSSAALTVFLSWFNLLLLLQRFDQAGIYVVMFLEILQTLIKVLLVFSILIIAFGLSFYILLSRISSESGNHLSFSSIPMSLMRTFSMMLGEIDFIGTYVQPYYRNEFEGARPFPLPAFLILGIFMVLMPILLMNLLIGLAVGDIESVRRNAQLKRLAMQVVLHTELERKIPQILLEKVDKMELIEYPNDVKCKLGFLDSVLRRWFGNPFNDDDMVLDNHEDYVTGELEKQKRRLKEITISLDTQHQLLRLLVQKMEIKTEADDVDEGVPPGDLRSTSVHCSQARWTSPRIRNKLRSALSFNKGQ